MKEPAIIHTHRFVVCPHCGEGESRVDHLAAGSTAGPWYCDDCGRSYVLEVAADGTLLIEKRAGVKVTTIDVLKLPPQTTAVYFIVEGMRFEGETWQDGSDREDSKRFYYESHSCPTNWLEPTMVYHEGDSDPHGLIEFVATRDDATFPRDETFGPNDRDRAFVAFIEEQLAPLPDPGGAR